MYVCMYVCMYACMYVCMYVRMYVCMHVCMYVCMYVCVYKCIFTTEICHLVQFSTCGFTQIGSEIVVSVGSEGAVSYDPVHGTTLYVAMDSLPDGIDEVTVSRKHGFNACKLDPSMQTCSATVYFKIEPAINFTKDVFIEIPHSFSSFDTQDLCFVKFNYDMDSTGSGEILPGLFPAEYPYGVITTRSFSSYKISTKKQFQSNKIEKKSRIRKLKPQHLRSEAKITKSKESQLIKKQLSVSNAVDHSLTPNAYWFSIVESADKRIVFLSLSQFTPTGHKVFGQPEISTHAQMTFFCVGIHPVLYCIAQNFDKGKY